MTQDELKRAAAQAALEEVPDRAVVGIGTGSTVAHFIDLLPAIRDRVDTVVSSSEASSQALRERGFDIPDLNAVPEIDVYVDGADEINPLLQMIKGGGGALTREKILAAVSRRVVCIADASKFVRVLGAFPLPIEVIPMARSHVARQLVALGGRPVLRSGFVTDNGNQILDVHDLPMQEPIRLERQLNQIVGLVTCGLFAERPADCLLLADERQGIRRLERNAIV